MRPRPRPPLVPFVFSMGLMGGLLAASVFLQYRTPRALQALRRGVQGERPR